MKKSILLLGVMCSISISSFSQGWYVKVQGGYNFAGLQNTGSLTVPRVDASVLYLRNDGLVPMANISEYSENGASGEKVYVSNTPVRGSYGKGGNVSLGAGYMFNKWFGLELGINYLWGATYSSTVSTINKTPPSLANPNGTTLDPNPIEATIKTSANGLSLSPSFVFVAAIPKWPVEPYAKVGLALPVYGASHHTVDVTLPDQLAYNNDGSVNSTMYNTNFLGKTNRMELETEGTVSLGVNWAVGVRYTPKNLSFITVFLESNGQWLNVRGKSTKITKYETNGEDRLNNANTSLNRPAYRQEFIYHDEIDANSNNEFTNPNYDQNKPKDDLRPIAPFSNIGIQVGIQLNFSKEALASLKKK